MIYDKWRTGRSAQYMEENTEPSMVEPCYNPTIRDYLLNPSLVARRGIYDEGSEEVVDDLPDPWNDEPLYQDLPPRGRKAHNEGRPKGETSVPKEDPGKGEEGAKEKDVKDDDAATAEPE